MNDSQLSGPDLAQQFKIRRAASLLDVDERTIRRLIKRGELPSIGRGRMRRIRLADLLDWQRRNRNGGEVS